MVMNTSESSFLREAADLIETTGPVEGTWNGHLVWVGATALDPALSMPLVAILRTAATTADRTPAELLVGTTSEGMIASRRDSLRLVQAALGVARVVLGRRS